MEILQSSQEGKMILDFYGKNKSLTDRNRLILIDMIALYFIQNDIHMSVTQCAKISNQIQQKFPSEAKVSLF